MSDLLQNSIVTIIDNYSKFFLNKKNVIGLGLGYKIIKNICTNEFCLGVFVDNKISENNIYKHDLIPQKFLGIKTDVIKSNLPKLNTVSSTIPINIALKNIDFGPTLKLQAGYSISPLGYKYYGTLGAIVFDNNSNAPYILSNNHVLSNTNELHLGTPIIQNNITTEKSKNIIAYLYKQVIIKSKESFNNVQDSAIAKILPNIPYTTEIYNIGKVTGIADAKPYIKIKKVGATTGYTTGIVQYTNTIFKMKNIENMENLSYKNLIKCSKISEKGDSGSLVLNKDNKAIGLLFAGDSENSEDYVIPISTILNVYNIHF